IVAGLAASAVRAQEKTESRAAPTTQRMRKVKFGFKPPRDPQVMMRTIQTQDVKAKGVAAAASRAGSPIAKPAAYPQQANIESVPSAFDWSDPSRPGGSVVTAVQDQAGW